MIFPALLGAVQSAGGQAVGATMRALVDMGFHPNDLMPHLQPDALPSSNPPQFPPHGGGGAGRVVGGTKSVKKFKGTI